MTKILKNQLVPLLALSLTTALLLTACNNSKELVSAVQANEADKILSSLAEGENPNSKSADKRYVLNLAVDNVIKYAGQRDQAFLDMLEKLDSASLEKPIAANLHFYYSQTQRKTPLQGKNFAEIGSNLSASKIALSKYLLYADLQTAFRKDPGSIKQVIRDIYTTRDKEDVRKAELRRLVGKKADSPDPVKPVKEYRIAVMSIDWLLMCGADASVVDRDNKRPDERLEEAGFTKLGKRVKNSINAKANTKNARQTMKKIREEIKNPQTTLFMDR